MTNNESMRILRNFLAMMPKTYRKRTPNWVVVRDVILSGTRTAGCTSCMRYCHNIGIDPDAYVIGDVQ